MEKNRKKMKRMNWLHIIFNGLLFITAILVYFLTDIINGAKEMVVFFAILGAIVFIIESVFIFINFKMKKKQKEIFANNANCGDNLFRKETNL